MWVRERLGAERVSERRACQVLGQVRSTQRRERPIPDDKARLVVRMVELATQYGRYGYRRVTAILHGEAKVLVERWRRHYNQIRPHSALAYRPPAPEAKLPRSQALDLIPWSGLQMVPGLT